MARVALAAHRVMSHLSITIVSRSSVLFTAIDSESESIESIKIQIEPIIEDD